MHPLSSSHRAKYSRVRTDRGVERHVELDNLSTSDVESKVAGLFSS